MKPTRSTVLIIASDPAFARDVTEHWHADAEKPDFILLDGDLCHELQRDTFDLAIADAPTGETRASLRETLANAGKPAIVIHSDPSLDCSIHGPILELTREPKLWPSVAGLLGREILRRGAAEARAQIADRERASAEAEATLGRYMGEMRHNTNNALTSILGNAELLLLEPGLPAKVLAQADTIRNMALRLHEVFRRFSSIEKELSVAARESGKGNSHPRAVGV